MMAPTANPAAVALLGLTFGLLSLRGTGATYSIVGVDRQDALAGISIARCVGALDLDIAVGLLGLLAGAAGQNTKSCSVFGMTRICAAHPIQCSTNCDPQKLCAEPCVKAMVACASDPTLGYYLGKNTGR